MKPAPTAAALAALGLGLALAAVGFLGIGGFGISAPTRGTVPVAVEPDRVTSLGASPGQDAEPVRLALPRLGVEAPVVGVAVERNGQLGVPDDPAVLGWWRDGALPGAAQGTVVIDGHVDSYQRGTGALFRLGTMQPGDHITVGTRNGSIRYVVAAVRTYRKADLPAEVFDRGGIPRLVLITCGGRFDAGTREYSDNIVVYAVPSPDSSATSR